MYTDELDDTLLTIKDMRSKNLQIKALLSDIKSKETYNLLEEDDCLITHRFGQNYIMMKNLSSRTYTLINFLKNLTKKLEFFEYCLMKLPPYIEIGETFHEDIKNYFKFVKKLNKTLNKVPDQALRYVKN